MTGPDHSKKPKNVTIDLSKDEVRVIDGSATTGDKPVALDVKAATAEAKTTTPNPSFSTSAAKPAEPQKAPGATTAPVAPKTGGGFFGKVGAGLVGGIVALAGAAGLQYAGQLPSFGNNLDVAVLQKQVSELAAKPAFDPAPLQAALDDANAEIAALKDQIGRLPAGSGDGAALSALNDKIAALETAFAALPAGTTGDPAAAVALKALSEKVAALETGQPAGKDASAVALAIAASGLKAAIDRGGPFPAELETYASVAAASADVDALRALAGAGVPSQSDLIGGFNDAANAMIAAATVPDPNASILQRLTDSATNLVKTRRVGAIEGDEPDAVVARMEVSLNRGDLDAVIAESAKLPDASKAAAKEWLDQVTARRDANSLVTRALGQALTAAGGKS